VIVLTVYALFVPAFEVISVAAPHLDVAGCQHLIGLFPSCSMARMLGVRAAAMLGPSALVTLQLSFDNLPPALADFRLFQLQGGLDERCIFGEDFANVRLNLLSAGSGHNCYGESAWPNEILYVFGAAMECLLCAVLGLVFLSAPSQELSLANPYNTPVEILPEWYLFPTFNVLRIS
jgi:hypothetical protein